jgi:branched-chain amino acid transport system permease protein
MVGLNPEFVLGVFASGIVAGAHYALLGLAVVLIFRTTGVANFAQGEIATISVFLFLMYATQLQVPIALQWLATIIVSAALGGAIFLVLLRPKAEGAEKLNLTVRTLGLYMLLNALALYWWGANEPYTVPSLFPDRGIAIGGFNVAYDQLGTLIVAAAVGLALLALFRFTQIGLAMRAVAMNAEVASLLGVNVRRISLVVWVIAGALSAVVGLLIAPVSFLESGLMQPYILKAFTAAILGGFQSFPGAILGGLMLGVAESIAGTWISIHLREPFTFAILLLVLLLRPRGLFSRTELERV